MKFTVEIDDKLLKQLFGNDMTQEDFNKFCSKAITSKMFQEQFAQKLGGESNGMCINTNIS